ncbi:hypothetical protein ACSCB1_18960 [Streptomyces europaeiscabiei]|uniref:Integral membrane protein n=1 Tax=Streptomyces europaeiscabiei TaxID=146819 RepID=A0ABU4NNL7_9ACTN|nr:hypothetical protein [Streptomyces europaeiscabiei]MDX2522883.1 hypothetical protein [Streptomyces europaeiscabiei]MDX2758829.1 hypothetical protein [Streptomyces europaeiscabiei]MDX2769249.1 hypothetical protein [Streptomyces europaeiscabiei]MDX3547127.1 hypothetical protein [Streptomyces europaeiscabiei]MDX3556952.1 hypothetical protein [Streptomyces europaeiscabiei]
MDRLRRTFLDFDRRHGGAEPPPNRRADQRVAVVVGAGDLLLCCVLLLVAVGALFVEPTTREQETVAWHLAGRIYGYWLVGGLVLFPVLRMTRTLVVHLATMIVTPVVLFVLVVLSAAAR